MESSLVTLGFAEVTLYAIVTVGCVLWLAAVFCMIQMVRNIKPDIGLFSSELLWNPCNVVFRPDLLTVIGLKYRRYLVFCAVGFAVTVISGFLWGFLLGLDLS